MEDLILDLNMAYGPLKFPQTLIMWLDEVSELEILYCTPLELKYRSEIIEEYHSVVECMKKRVLEVRPVYISVEQEVPPEIRREFYRLLRSLYLLELFC